MTGPANGSTRPTPTRAEVSFQTQGVVFSIGQLDADDLRWLNSEVKAGRLVKVKASWPWIFSGTTRKTAWVSQTTAAKLGQ